MIENIVSGSIRFEEMLSQTKIRVSLETIDNKSFGVTGLRYKRILVEVRN